MNPSQFAGAALIAFGLTEFTLRRGASARRLKTTAADRGTTPLIFACYALVVGLLFVPRIPGVILPASVAWAAVGVAFAGLILRWWAMLILGRFYTRTLLTTAGQGVVSRGPYRWVRHPGYLGSLLTWVGAAAASRNLGVTMVVVALLVALYVHRIRAEELMLAKDLGQDYVDYQQRSWRLIPLIY
jgi:protein-S-isoprenylcysteine O-methyltransferase Ste14